MPVRYPGSAYEELASRYVSSGIFLSAHVFHISIFPPVCSQLRCLYLQQNLISKIVGLEGLNNLVQVRKALFPQVFCNYMPANSYCRDMTNPWPPTEWRQCPVNIDNLLGLAMFRAQTDLR